MAPYYKILRLDPSTSVIRQGALMGSNRARKRQQLWKRETMAVGDLLLDALALERYLSEQAGCKPTDDLLGQWIRCRRTLSRLIADYVNAVTRYRILVRRKYLLRAGR